MPKCGSCKYYSGGGDWNLCCNLKYDLCYENTEACEQYEFAHNCRTCSIPHNKWTGCPKLNGKIPYPTFVCEGYECDDNYKYYLENTKWKKPNSTNHIDNDYPN